MELVPTLDKQIVDTIKAMPEPEVAIGKMIRNNAMFRGFIQKLKAKDRRSAYTKIKPYLSFKPWPYFALMTKKQVEPEGRCVLTCQTCTTKEVLIAESQVDAAIQARDLGWKLIAGMMFCPKCSEAN
jgi:hypothetical protein